jgi:hypothetical protein
VSRKIAASLSSFKVEVKPTEKPGATTLSITTLIIMTFRITILSIKGLFATSAYTTLSIRTLLV